MATTFSRLHVRRVARWLIASLLFTLLHPAFASGLALARDEGGLVEVCTGAGMAWVRIVDGAAQAADTTATAPEADQARQSRDGEARSSASPCPFCLGAALLATDGARGDGVAVDWPVRASPAPANPPSSRSPCARIILDAPLRGPPGRLPHA